MTSRQGTAGSASRSTSFPKKSILAGTRLKFFGPTLDESLLYGIDRLIDSLWQSATTTARHSFESDEQNLSLYQSCETLPIETDLAGITTEHSPQSKSLFPKLSQDEMDYLLNAIEQSRRKSTSNRRTKDTKPTATRDASTQPQLRQTRWAVARINEYDDGAKTYEIIKSLDEKRLPRDAIPTGTEIVFAVLKNGASLCDRGKDLRAACRSGRVCDTILDPFLRHLRPSVPPLGLPTNLTD
ncbi:uncharacterized protein LOC126576835 [Anopheles aquasalis]|uniref:uncharacterized protein LOC126576835 n=1 Tax=Anopheles aquasalis TaxID=42839 RepID=UPI00215B4963|nr:uncharacterized protein LOC126576835 [Anopheles aquasalis]